MSNRHFKAIVPLLFLFAFAIAEAQVALLVKESGNDLRNAMDLFSKEKYSASIKMFDAILADPLREGTIEYAEAGYFGAIAAMKLYHPDAEYRMNHFLGTNPSTPRRNDAFMELGDFFYQSKNYRKAVEAYESVHRLELSPERLPAFFFKLGYSLMMRGERPRAMLMFSEIKDVDTDYTSPALYYFSHLAYEDEKYLTAMDGFTKLRNDETFGGVVPFYIVQILYKQKDYDGILEIAPGLISSAGKEREIELYRFIGDAYYNKGDYQKAVEYLEKFSGGTRISSREDKYQLAYSYYNTGESEKAIKLLNELVSKNDLLSQNAWNILGACYIQQNDKYRARLTFGAASKMDFDRKLKEEALFNYAKLTYETSPSPFGEVIAAFQEYISEFPGSGRIDEAYNYLVSTYIQVRNYQAALTSLDKIARKDDKLNEAYQKVSFFRGLELFRNQQIDQAIDMFDKSLKLGQYNRQIRARSLYWRGEAYYRRKEYARAVADFQEFMGIPGASLTGEYRMVRYNLGYSFYNTADYSRALNMFKAYEADPDKGKPDILADTRNRIADCYYISTEYANAISYYDMVIGYGKDDADYAMFQKGFAQGLTNNQTGKIETLSLLMSRYPNSYLLPDALYERGRAYISVNNVKAGETDLMGVINSHKISPFAPRAHIQLGLLYYNLGDYQKAIAQYKTVVERYRSTDESRGALTGLKNAYVDMNDVEGYFTYVKTLGGYGDVNLSERDSMLFRSGETHYLANNCIKASEVLNSYIREFPNGFFRTNAQFYLAECLFAAGKNDEASVLYKEIINSTDVQFAEQALGALADIAYDNEDFVTALSYYEQLEKIVTRPETLKNIYAGQLRSAAYSGDPAKTVAIADRILKTPGIPEDLVREASFMAAKAHYSLNNETEALKYFRMVSNEVVTVEGAESKYRVGEILFKGGQVAESEKVVNEFIGMNTPHQFWMARVFILLADISIRKDDKLQARATLQGLLDYYSIDNDGILDEVRAKLDELSK
jgi:tetratricopeptide (TPR) repeat protein